MEITGYPNYLIYDDGRVYNKKFKRFLKPQVIKEGYLRLGLSNNGKRKMFLIHRLVALHYIPNPQNKLEVDHINSITNDNSVENLQWLTSQENNDKRNLISNTGEKYISYCKKHNGYNIRVKGHRQYLYCKDYDLQDAINLRDALLNLV